MLYFNNHLIKLQIYNTNTISQNPSFRVIAIKTLFPIADAIKNNIFKSYCNSNKNNSKTRNG